VILALVAAAVASPECNKLADAIATDQCVLTQSMNVDPPPNCVKRANQFDMNVCSFRDYLRADIELNRAWMAATKRLAGQPKTLDVLLTGQRAWRTYRDKQCDVWANLYEGGTIVPLAVNSCLTDITKFRIKELGQLVDNRKCSTKS
jgi:uncharacterized protein YecT (DUF1311 family)